VVYIKEYRQEDEKVAKFTDNQIGLPEWIYFVAKKIRASQRVF
jgi:hypothetical protein